MKSNICIIEKDSASLDAILKESEKVAVYNDLDNKQTMHLRLLCEELHGMLPELIGDFKGKFWIDFEKGLCKVNVSIEIEEINPARKAQLIDLAKNKKNSAATGIGGKIRSAIENIMLDINVNGIFVLPMYGMEDVSVQHLQAAYAQYWSLNQYKNAVKAQNKKEAWDELEKSVIASVADDVIAGIKGKNADIIVIKNFG